MSLKFNIDRPKASDEEIEKRKNFKELVERFKQQSLKKAQGDESWWKNKKISYSTVIVGITVICTITYSAIKTKSTNTKHETLTTKNQLTKSSNTQKAFVSAPSQKLKVPYSTYKIDSNKGGKIMHSSSSKISIPQNSFVDKHGKDIVGEVSIEYREFHDLGDILVSGIPMAYDSAGHKYNLESAGMFEIKGSQNGEPIFIKENKNIEIELASQNAENRFNQYYLDTLARNWIYLKKDNAAPIFSSQKNEHRLSANKSMVSEKVQRLENEIAVILPKKIDSVKTVYTEKLDKLPVYREPKKPAKPNKGRPSFKLDGSNDEFPELAAFNNVLFEVGPENKNYRKELHDITWSDVKISQGPDKGTNYLLTLSYRNQTEKLIVYPVLEGNDYEKAINIYNQKFDTYQALTEKKQGDERRLLAEMEAKQRVYLQEQKKKEEELKKERTRLVASTDALAKNELASNFNALDNKSRATRLFSVSKFGIFNSDCPQPNLGNTNVKPVFTEKNDRPIIPDVVYLVDHSQKTVYLVGAEDSFRFRYNNDNEYTICIFKKNNLYLCNKNQFKQSVENENNRFPVVALPDNIDNLEDFKKALEI
ncbi:MAG: hypothetical protein JNL60_00600 [Bacteroidia bacterium]|nr:hypothetical protein [Bacteroidia bacterium]